MTILYSCRHDGDLYRISKFNDGNVESSYLTDGEACDCPAGQRRVCRHREMLPLFIRRGAINSGWQLDYDRGGWVQMYADEVEHTTPADTLPSLTIEVLPVGERVNLFGKDGLVTKYHEYADPLLSEASTTPADTFTDTQWDAALMGVPEGVQVLSLNDPLAIHNAIAEAVGEPEAMIPPPAKPWRRF